MDYRTGPAVEILDKFSRQNSHKMEPIPAKPTDFYYEDERCIITTSTIMDGLTVETLDHFR